MKTLFSQTVFAFSSSTLIRSAVAVSVLTSFAACSPKKSDDSHKINTASIMADRNLTEQQKAEELALAAEQLVGASSVIYANDVASLALQIDAKNVRARFWQAALGPEVQSRGLANRIAPLMHNLGKDSEYQEFLSNMRKGSVDSQNVKFLMDGPQDIVTERDVQEYVAQTTLRVDEFRRTMKSLRNETLSIHLNTDLKKSWNPSGERANCTATQVEGGYSTTCDFSKASTIDLNSADFESLELAAAGTQIYMTVYNGWDLSGTISFVKAHPSVSGEDPNTVAAALFANPNFGKMLKPSAFGVIPDLAKDIVIGARYAQTKQAELCPTGDSNQVNREGKLFEKGICTSISSQADAQLVALEASLGGTSTVFDLGSGSAHSPHLVNLRKLFTGALRDVRTNFPVQRNACGYVTSISDSTFNGAFVPGDINQSLAQTSTADCSSN